MPITGKRSQFLGLALFLGAVQKKAAVVGGDPRVTIMRDGNSIVAISEEVGGLPPPYRDLNFTKGFAASGTCERFTPDELNTVFATVFGYAHLVMKPESPPAELNLGDTIVISSRVTRDARKNVNRREVRARGVTFEKNGTNGARPRIGQADRALRGSFHSKIG